MSFPRRRESSHFNRFWIPAYAGMTAFGLFTRTSILKTFTKMLRKQKHWKRIKYHMCLLAISFMVSFWVQLKVMENTQNRVHSMHHLLLSHALWCMKCTLHLIASITFNCTLSFLKDWQKYICLLPQQLRIIRRNRVQLIFHILYPKNQITIDFLTFINNYSLKFWQCCIKKHL